MVEDTSVESLFFMSFHYIDSQGEGQEAWNGPCLRVGIQIVLGLRCPLPFAGLWCQSVGRWPVVWTLWMGVPCAGEVDDC